MNKFFLLILFFGILNPSSTAQIIEYKLENPEFGPNDSFGQSIAVNDNWVAVSAFKNMSSTGLVLMYQYSPNGWVLKQELIPVEALEGDYIGSDLAISDDHLVIGSSGNGGKVFVYELINEIWTESTTLLPPDNFANSTGNVGSAFGSTVNIHNDKIIVGAFGLNFVGAAVLYTLEPSGWEQKQIFSGGSSEYDSFGGGVDLSDEWLAICSYKVNFNFERALEVLLYKWDGDQFIYQESIFSPYVNESYTIPFRYAELTENQLMIGNYRNSTTNNNTGGVKVYTLDNDEWDLEFLINPPEFEIYQTGRHVAHSESFGMFGATGLTANTGDNKAHVLIYQKEQKNEWNQIGLFSFQYQTFGGYSLDVSENYAAASTDGNVNIYDFSNLNGTSVFDTETLGFKIYPTVTRSQLNLKSDEIIEEIKIYNLIGKEVHSEKYSTTLNHELNLSHLLPGEYFIKATKNEYHAVQRKFIKI